MSGFPRLINRMASAETLAGFPDFPPLLARLYASRGLSTAAETQLGLDALPAPSMLGLDAAVSALETAIAKRQKLLIVGDFDCDGATSTSLAILGLKALGAAAVDFLVPNRFEYGYGLSPEIVAVAAERRPDLIITVDNGIASIDGVAAANRHGIPVIVTDHHLPGDALPDALAIVNPNQPGCPFPINPWRVLG